MSGYGAVECGIYKDGSNVGDVLHTVIYDIKNLYFPNVMHTIQLASLTPLGEGHLVLGQFDSYTTSSGAIGYLDFDSLWGGPLNLYVEKVWSVTARMRARRCAAKWTLTMYHF